MYGKSPRQWALPEYTARQRQDGPDSGQQALPVVKAFDCWSGFYFIFQMILGGYGGKNNATGHSEKGNAHSCRR